MAVCFGVRPGILNDGLMNFNPRNQRANMSKTLVAPGTNSCERKIQNSSNHTKQFQTTSNYLKLLQFN